MSDRRRTPERPTATSPVTFRGRAERVSYPVLAWVHNRPRWLVVGVLTALLVAGLLAPVPIGVPCLAVLVAFLGWLAYLAWPVGDRSRRVLRLLAIGLGIGALLARILAG